MSTQKPGDGSKRNRSGKSWLLSLFDVKWYRISTTHNDRILPETHWTAFFIVPFLLVGFVVLMFWPDDTNLLFAWSIQSRMTALMLAAVYAGGAYFFSRVYLARQWHTVAMGFLPATLYAVLGGLITIIHWDDFNHSSIAFTVWVAMYGISSGLIPFVWWRNHQMDPRMPFPQDVILPKPFIYLWIFMGMGNLLIGGFLFILPGLAGSIWPWPIMPLAARVIGSLFAILGVTSLALMADRRWSSAQVIMETAAVIFALILLAVTRSWANFNPANPLTWVFITVPIILLVGICVLYLWVEVR